MEAEFWLERWRDGRTHFHQSRVTPLLQKYWPTLMLPHGCQVLVPLAGKSLDMIWLAEQGHRVLGVELSQLAVEQFFDENKLCPQVRETACGRHFEADDISVICGDIFRLDAALLSACAGVYDRAALVALPPAMRADYVRQIYGSLASSCRGLLITLDYPQEQMNGPPFSVGDAEIQDMFSAHSEATLIDRRDILDKEPKFIAGGVTRLDSLVYALRRKH